MSPDSQSFYPMNFQQQEMQGYPQENFGNNGGYPGSPTKISQQQQQQQPLNIKRKKTFKVLLISLF